MQKTDQKQKVPKLRFPEFSGEWEEKKLGAVSDVTSSKRVYSSDYVSKGIPFFRGKEISELKRSHTASDILYIKESKYLEFKSKFGAPQKGDLLITSVGTLGNTYKVDLDYDFYFKDGNLIWLRNISENSDFLEMAIDFHKKGLLLGVIGSTQKALTIEGIKKVKISFPSSPEQQKIASFLSSADEWIANLKAQKESLEQYKKGMMQRLFSSHSREDGNPTPSLRFKDDNGQDFPEWEEKRLGEVADFFKGRGISKEDINKDGVNECIRYGELYTTYDSIVGEIKSRTNFPLTEGIMSKKNDVIIPSSGETALDIATTSCVLKSGVLLGGDLNILRFSTEMSGEFFAYYLSSFHKVNIAKLAQGNSVVHLYASHLKTLRIFVPSLEEQQKIANFLTSIDNLINSKQLQISQAEEWKRGLMQGLFV